MRKMSKTFFSESIIHNNFSVIFAGIAFKLKNVSRKNAFLGYKRRTLKKSKTLDFSKEVSPWFWSKIGFFPSFLIGNIGQENVLYYILEKKNAFLGYKNKKLKNSKNWDFSNGVSPWLWSKIVFLPSFFLGNKGEENVFYYSRTQKRLSRL